MNLSRSQTELSITDFSGLTHKLMDQIIWSKEIDGVLNCGILLEKFGIRNWALTKQQAFLAISRLLRLEVPILGGDVCAPDEFGRILPNYDSWHCERRTSEEKHQFVARSLVEAKIYIESYPVSDKVFFVFVPDMEA